MSRRLSDANAGQTNQEDPPSNEKPKASRKAESLLVIDKPIQKLQKSLSMNESGLMVAFR